MVEIIEIMKRAKISYNIDVDEFMILVYISNWLKNQNKKFLYQDKTVYVWIDYNTLLKNMPFLSITTKQSLVKKIMSLKEKKAISVIKQHGTNRIFCALSKEILSLFSQKKKMKTVEGKIDKIQQATDLDKETERKRKSKDVFYLLSLSRKMRVIISDLKESISETVEDDVFLIAISESVKEGLAKSGMSFTYENVDPLDAKFLKYTKQMIEIADLAVKTLVFYGSLKDFMVCIVSFVCQYCNRYKSLGVYNLKLYNLLYTDVFAETSFQPQLQKNQVEIPILS